MTFWNPGDTVNFILFSPYVALKGEGFICRCISSPWRIELVLATLVLAEVFFSCVVVCSPILPVHYSFLDIKTWRVFSNIKRTTKLFLFCCSTYWCCCYCQPRRKQKQDHQFSFSLESNSDTGYSFITSGYHHNLEYLFCIFDESIRLIFVSSKLWGLCCGNENFCKQGQTNFVCKWNGLVVKGPKVEMHHVVPFCKLGQSGQLERCVWCRATLFT